MEVNRGVCGSPPDAVAGPACSSRIVRALAAPLLLVALLATAVGAYETAREAGRLPAAFPSVSIVNTDPFNLSSFALSLLLVRRIIGNRIDNCLINSRKTQEVLGYSSILLLRMQPG